jgi:hypothetical protein
MVGVNAPAVLEAVSTLRCRVSQITLQLPTKRNALSKAMVSALQDIVGRLHEMTQSGECRGVLLRSTVQGMCEALLKRCSQLSGVLFRPFTDFCKIL